MAFPRATSSRHTVASKDLLACLLLRVRVLDVSDDARDHDNDATVSTGSTGRHDVTRSVRNPSVAGGVVRHVVTGEIGQMLIAASGRVRIFRASDGSGRARWRGRAGYR